MKCSWHIFLEPFQACIVEFIATSCSRVTCQKQSWVSSSVFGFSRAIERFGIERYKLNTSKVCMYGMIHFFNESLLYCSKYVIILRCVI